MLILNCYEIMLVFVADNCLLDSRFLVLQRCCFINGFGSCPVTCTVCYVLFVCSVLQYQHGMNNKKR
jgi:hypothetical protein